MFYKPAQFIYWTASGFLISLTGWFVLMLIMAIRIKNAAPDITHLIQAGPFILNTLTKQTIEGGYTVIFTFESGWAAYGCCTVAATIISYWVYTRTKKYMRTQKDSPAF